MRRGCPVHLYAPKWKTKLDGDVVGVLTWGLRGTAEDQSSRVEIYISMDGLVCPMAWRIGRRDLLFFSSSRQSSFVGINLKKIAAEEKQRNPHSAAAAVMFLVGLSKISSLFWQRLFSHHRAVGNAGAIVFSNGQLPAETVHDMNKIAWYRVRNVKN